MHARRRRRRRRPIREIHLAPDSPETSTAPRMYRCFKCGGQHDDWLERCPECGERGYMQPYDPNAAQDATERYGLYKTLGKVRSVKMPRIVTGVPGMDRVLGDERERGLVVPSVVLFGGGQGAGKSSISLQAAAGIDPRRRVLYLLNEEPESRLRDRATRLGFGEAAIDHIAVCESEQLADYAEAMATVDPHVVVLDSLSLMKDDAHDTPDEQANRLRYAEWLFKEAMTNKRAVIAISHLNKQDDIAGLRKIQYKLDAIMTITKVGLKHALLQCPEKNRFGEAGVPVYFSIGRDGLHEVEKAEAIKAAMAEERAERGGDEAVI